MRASRSRRWSTSGVALAAVTIVSGFVMACGALIGVTDPELLKADSGSTEAGVSPSDSGSSTDAGSVGPTCDAAGLSSDPENCGACGTSCQGKACNSGTCEGDLANGSLGDIREIVVGGPNLYVAQSDGIYQTSKASTIIGKKISDIQKAKLSVDNGAKTLYAVGFRGTTRVGASCLIPCSDSSAWKPLDGLFPADATSVVPVGSGYLIGQNQIWSLGSYGSPRFTNASTYEDQGRGSRVRWNSLSMVWTMKGNNTVYFVDQTVLSHDAQKYFCQECTSLGVDVLYGYFNSTPLYLLVDNGNVVSTSLDSKKQQIVKGITLYTGGDALGLEVMDSGHIYIRAPKAIHVCSTLVGSLFSCIHPVHDEPDEIVSMAAGEGKTFYYAEVSKAGTPQATGKIIKGVSQ